jgi:hypothetical protein
MYLERHIDDTRFISVNRTAARCGNFQMFKHTFTDALKDTLVAWDIARSGNLEMLTWAIERGCEIPINADLAAAKSGNVHLLKWMMDTGRCVLRADLFRCAAGNEGTSCMEYLQSIGCPSDATACAKAVRSGQIKNVKWLRDNGHSWDADTCVAAASIGRLDILMWCRKEGCPWDYRVCSRAAENRHRDILRWAIARGCDCITEVTSFAIGENDMNQLEWLKRARVPFSVSSYDIARNSRAHGSLEWLNNNGTYVNEGPSNYGQWTMRDASN